MGHFPCRGAWHGRWGGRGQPWQGKHAGGLGWHPLPTWELGGAAAAESRLGGGLEPLPTRPSTPPLADPGAPLSCGWGSVLPPRDAGRVGLSTAGCGGCKGGGKALGAQTFGKGRAAAGYSRVDGDDLLATPTDQQHPVQMLRQHLQELHVWGDGQGLSVQQRPPPRRPSPTGQPGETQPKLQEGDAPEG